MSKLSSFLSASKCVQIGDQAKEKSLYLYFIYLYIYLLSICCLSAIFSLSPLRARKSDNYRWKSDNIRERGPSKKKQRTDTKKDAKRKSDNFTWGNRESRVIKLRDKV